MHSSLDSLTVSRAGSIPAQQGLALLLVAPEDSDLDALVQRTTDRYPGWRVTRVGPGADWKAHLSEAADAVLIEQSLFDLNISLGRVEAAEVALAELRERFPQIRIIVFGHDMTDVFVRRMLRLGVHGLIDSGTVYRERLGEAIQEVCHGGYWVARSALEKLIHSAVEMERVIEREFVEQVASMQEVLTRREADVLERVLEGLSTRDIAGQLFLSEQGVKLHLSRLFKKFGVSNRAQLILHAFRRVCPFNSRVAHYFRQTRAQGSP
jgi:DNA-binding NarL/FixJ family response regulator